MCFILHSLNLTSSGTPSFYSLVFKQATFWPPQAINQQWNISEAGCWAHVWGKSLSVFPPNLEVFYSLFLSFLHLFLLYLCAVCSHMCLRGEQFLGKELALSSDFILSHSPDAFKCLHNLFSSSKVISETISMCSPSKVNIVARTTNQKLLLNCLYLVIMLCTSVLYLFSLTVKIAFNCLLDQMWKH